jgi:hypothetical protein
MRRFRATTRGTMIAVAVVALTLRRAELGMLALVLILSFVAVRRLFDAPKGSRPYSWARSYLVTIACVYLPYGWLVVQDYPWDDYRWEWVKMWPILPGLFPAILLFHQHRFAVPFVAPAFTALLIALFTWRGSFRGLALAISSTVALIVSVFLSWVSYQLFLW